MWQRNSNLDRNGCTFKLDSVRKSECFLIDHFLQVQAVLKRKEEEDQQMKQVVQTLQLALEKEKTKVKDLKEQVRVLSLTSAWYILLLLTFKS